MSTETKKQEEPEMIDDSIKKNANEEIKDQISPEKSTEIFLYHGTVLDNHKKIISTHFLMPGEDYRNQGFYGKESMPLIMPYNN